MIMKRQGRALAVVVALSLVIVACGDDDEVTTTSAPTANADFNGDGKVLIGVATDGPRDDGAYYQALVERVEEIAAANDLEEPIIVDRIDPANAEDELRNIAEQGVDIIAVGSSALSESLPDLIAEYPEIFWYCNCGSNYQETPGLFISRDRGAELWISGGYAAGLLMQSKGVDSAVFLGCCDLSFEKESFAGFQHGLALVDDTFTATYVATGAFPFDFNNTAGATEAFNSALAEGVDTVVPFLGGAHGPIAQLANDNGLIVSSGGSSKACDRTDPDYDFMVKYDTGDYLAAVLADVFAGTAVEGTSRDFHVGIGSVVGAEFCAGATAEQIAMLDALNARIGAGEFAEVIDAILAAAYGS